MQDEVQTKKKRHMEQAAGQHSSGLREVDSNNGAQFQTLTGTVTR